MFTGKVKFEGLFRDSFPINGVLVDDVEYFKYTGDVDHQFQPHGQGEKCEIGTPNHIGEWKHGKRHGHGVQSMKLYFTSAGTVYESGFEGEFVNDKRHGRGKATYSDGSFRFIDYVDGVVTKSYSSVDEQNDSNAVIPPPSNEIINTFMQRRTALSVKLSQPCEEILRQRMSPQQITLVQELFEKYRGRSREHYPCDETPVDESFTGRRVYSNSTCDANFYDGEYVNGQQHGIGFGEFHGCYYFIGLFEKAKMTHFGVFMYDTNDEIDVQGISNKAGVDRLITRLGNCIVRYNQDDVYYGMFEKNRREGYGLYASDSGIYNGEWKNDLKHGQGTMLYPNNDLYKGGFKNGKKHGPGKLVNASGEVLFDGKYVNGKKQQAAIAPAMSAVQSSVVSGAPLPAIRSEHDTSSNITAMVDSQQHDADDSCGV